MRIHWHRRDLRLSDNRGLADAPDSPVGLFVFDEAVLDHAAPPRVAFLLDALSSLRAAYRDRGSELFVRRGDPADAVPALAADLDASVVSWNRDYSGLAADRDDRVADALDAVGVTPQRFHDAICHPPGTITTNAGDPYSVYSYFWKKWRDREKDDPHPLPSLAEAADGSPVPTLAELGFDEPTAEIPDAGTAPARERLEAFLDDDIYRYAEARDYPARECPSRLSPHLKFGTIGIREVEKRVREAIAAADTDAERESAVEFRSQLAWREFYTHVLAFNPEVVTENYKDYDHEIDWENDPDLLDAWKRGETGYPIVDAGMRQLREEAYMHNRVRMIVASFLTKDLLVDWRHGYAHFRKRLVDHDTANDNGGWQWAASTGTDAQPYFRIFNPMTQGERYDPDAAYIHEYVPELSGVDADVIHSWHELSPTQRANAAPAYPEPVVDHSQRREQALEMFERARGDD